jgi:hypothetical protein
LGRKTLTELAVEQVIFEGQVIIQFIKEAFADHNDFNYQFILVDCSEETMAARLTGDRDQPELLTPYMRNWLGYHRRQAQEMGFLF